MLVALQEAMREQVAEATQSRWSSTTQSSSDIEQFSFKPEPVKMSEGNVLTRIRKAVSPPKRQTGFEKFGSEIELMSPPATAFLNHTSSTQSFLSMDEIRPVRSNRRPSQIERSSPKPPSPPSSRCSPEPEKTTRQSKPKTPKTSTPSSLTNGTSFELTPLSELIAQSFTDIRLIRRLTEMNAPTYPAAIYSPTSSPKEKHKNNNPASNSKTDNEHIGKTSPQVQQSMIDYAKVEENLRKFEELYRQFLNYGGKHGESAEEVHLVAVVCKRSDVVKGQVGVGDGSVPRVQKVYVDCGI